MASQASPLASLTQTLPEPIQVRPAVPVRTASSRTIPGNSRSTLPRIHLAIPSDALPDDVQQGVREIAREAVRENVRVVEGGAGQLSGQGSWVWTIRFEKRDDLRPGAMVIECSHDDFTTLPDGEEFSIKVSYNRPIEAFRALGHILGISRGLATFSPHSPTSSSFPSASDIPGSGANTPMDTDGTPAPEANGSKGGEIKWTGNVGAQLRREEECLFETVGVMIDCSRNGVLRVERVKTLLRHLALMGSNMLQLYCEDTYQIPGEPFFGYFRGPYTESELREIDDYAFTLGIEVIPCIQTLGHLGQMLQWPKYGHLRDTAEVLLAESEETYAFIEKASYLSSRYPGSSPSRAKCASNLRMIRSISGPLRSKRIHIGMDEAHGVSEGRYRQIFGYKDGTQVFTDHLRRVNKICVEQGLNPMIWSDMLFCLPAKNNQLSGYYDPNSVVTAELANSIPSEIETVFWDYYHTDSRPYTAKIAQHWQLAGKAPWMASGVWTWSRFWTALPFTFATVRASMKASKEANAGVKHTMCTIWGDEGNEFDLYSALPGILYHSELAYTAREVDEVDAALFRRKFDGIVGADLDDYVYASKLDDTQPESQPIDARTHYTPNISKFLLWEEPFFSFLSPQYRGFDLEHHFSALASYLEQALSTDFSTMTRVSLPHSINDFPLNSRLRLPYLLASVLSLKCHLRERLVTAYKSGDREELEALGGREPLSRMHRLRALAKELHDQHRENWFDMYKPFGWEVLDLRYGGLEARLETMHQRLIAYLDPNDTNVTKVEELEVELETVYPNSCFLMLDYSRAARATYI
ncbi:Hexosaminidase D [Rhodotorula toruloides]|nr:Hexosaminidase D [Rhodotorula toruloides]